MSTGGPEGSSPGYVTRPKTIKSSAKYTMRRVQKLLMHIVDSMVQWLGALLLL